MPSQTIPCADCEGARSRFERLGFAVHGCSPHPTQAGMCVISFEPPSAFPRAGDASFGAPADAVSGSVTSGPKLPSTAATGAIARPAAASPLAPELTDTQVRAAKAIVNIFETGAVLGQYGQVTLLPGDSGRLTYGRSQTTLGSGKLVELLQQYADNPGARFGSAITSWLPQFDGAPAYLDTATRLHNLLRACADDPVMRETQDRFFDLEFWQPALQHSSRAGVHTALGIAIVYDSLVHGSWARLRKATDEEIGGSASQVGEQRWIARYVVKRREWLSRHSNPILRNTLYRMDAFQRLIDLQQWGLALPLVVRETEISRASLNGTPPGCYDGPPPGSRSLSLADPLPRGLDVRLLQLALSDLGAEIKADGVFGTASARCVKEVQIARGLPVTGVADIALIGTLVV